MTSCPHSFVSSYEHNEQHERSHPNPRSSAPPRLCRLDSLTHKSDTTATGSQVASERTISRFTATRPKGHFFRPNYIEGFVNGSETA